MKTKQKFVVTAFEFSKGCRVTITQRLRKKSADEVRNELIKSMDERFKKYKFFTDIRVETRTPEYNYKLINELK
jgi:hypothetical protein